MFPDKREGLDQSFLDLPRLWRGVVQGRTVNGPKDGKYPRHRKSHSGGVLRGSPCECGRFYHLHTTSPFKEFAYLTVLIHTIQHNNPIEACKTKIMNSVDKRKGEMPIPENLEDYLNESQMLTIHRIINFGWEIRFIRRPLFQYPVAVLWNPQGEQIGILEEDGRINLESDIQLRDKK